MAGHRQIGEHSDDEIWSRCGRGLRLLRQRHRHLQMKQFEYIVFHLLSLPILPILLPFLRHRSLVTMRRKARRSFLEKRLPHTSRELSAFSCSPREALLQRNSSKFKWFQVNKMRRFSSRESLSCFYFGSRPQVPRNSCAAAVSSKDSFALKLSDWMYSLLG